MLNKNILQRCFENTAPVWCSALRCMIVLFLLGLFILPHSAQASCSGDLCSGDVVNDSTDTGVNLMAKLKEIAVQVSEYGEFAKIYESWVELKNVWGELMGRYTDSETLQTKLQLTGMLFASHLDEKMMQARIDATTQNTLLKQQIKDQADNLNPPPSDQFLCNVLIARQAPTVLVEFARMISQIVRKGVDATYRGAHTNGNGPQYYDDVYRQRCGELESDPSPSMNPIEDIPDSMANCIAASTSIDGMSDMDISADTFSRDKVYQMPPVKLVDQTIYGQNVQVMTFDIVDEDEDPFGHAAQTNWIKASKLCYTLAGPRPSPPTGDLMDTAEGKRKRVQYDACRAQQNAFIKTCSDRLAVLTRPNCEMDEMQPFCDVAIDSCAAARESGLQLSPRFNDCKNGLSLYEQEFISNLMCGSARRIQTETLARETEDDKIRVFALCNHLSNAYQKRIDEEDRMFGAGARAMRSIQECYNSIK